MATKKTEPDAPTTEAGAPEVQAKVDEAESQGVYGNKVDPTPDEHYSVSGVTAGLPTPETDPDSAAEARKAAGLR